MFKIKRADGYPFETMVYAVKEAPEEIGEYKLKFLIHFKGNWDWVYANDYIPVKEVSGIPNSITPS